jgi:hypothetical protein
MTNEYKVVKIEMLIDGGNKTNVNICKTYLYTDISVEQLKLTLNSNDIVIKDMIFEILKLTNLEKSYYDLYENIKYYYKLHPTIKYKIKVNEQ